MQEQQPAESTTVFASLNDYEPGGVQVIDDDAKNYVFSNVLDVAEHAQPFERICVAKNFEYVVEAMRSEGESTWFAAGHDEFALCMDGEVRIDLAKRGEGVATGPQGAVRLDDPPVGPKMGYVVLRRGHQALLPLGAAYRFSSAEPATVLIQTLDGALTLERWATICQQR